MTDKLTAALRLAEQSHRVFPLAINGKVPAIDGNWRVVATSDPARIRSLWTCPVMDVALDYNIGIAIDQKTVVLDVDVRDGKKGEQNLAAWQAINGDLPATYEVHTASGGRHLYFACEDSSGFPAKLVAGVDIKGHGGFVVAPGSEIDGKAYAGSDNSVVPAPELLDTLRAARAERPRAGVGAASLVDPDAPAAIARATDWLTNGAPDHGTYAVACKLKDFGVSEDMALELMLEHWPPAAAKGEEHVGFRVRNAYQYGQNPIGIASAEAEFDAAEVDAKPAPKRRGLHFIPWENAAPELDRPYLIDDVIDAGAMVVTYGDSNVGKTYVVLDQAFHIAAGREWNGHKVKGGLVVYVAAEGGGGFAKRIEAFKRHYKADKVPFALVPCPIDLQSDQADTGKLIRLIRDAEAHYGTPCALIVVDTLARAMGGGDENTATDMGKFVAHCDRLRAVVGAAVNVVHHTGKDKAKGARGSSALRAATDTEIEVAAGKLAVNKQRDMAALAPLHFRLTSLEVGQRADGKAVTACVVEWTAENEFEMRVSPLAEKFLGLLGDLMDAAESDEERPFIEWTEWQAAGRAECKTEKNTAPSRTYLNKLRNELKDAALVELKGTRLWRTAV